MKALKWFGIGVGILFVLLIIAGAALHFTGRSRLARAPQVAVVPVSAASDEASIPRGEHLAQAIAVCSSCHGENLAGAPFIDGAPIGYIPATNLTSGAGGVGTMTDEQWAAAIRHGIGHDGRTLATMPSSAYAQLSDADLAALIAYLKQLPPVDNELGPRRIQFPGTIFLGVFGASSLPVNAIDHAAVGGATPAVSVTADYGAYLSEIGACHECHAANLAGNTDPNGSPMGPNITPGGTLANYNQNQFLAFMRSGVTPDGRQVSPEMPWDKYSKMTDEEIGALWSYLSALEPLADNQ